MTVKKLGEAVNQATEKEERSKNIVIIFGAAEEENQPLESQVELILQHIGQKLRIVQCCRPEIVNKDGSTRVPAE